VRALSVVLDDAAAKALEQAEREDDGWTRVTVELEDPTIAAHQLIGLGDEVEVIKPAAVRDAFRAMATRMADRHR
jgi:predicted DNA-binding transcriptional regulator YafY